MDPMRKVPEKLPDLDGRWHVTTQEQTDAWSKYLGIPYVHVPDIFGCCNSWAEHFEKVWETGCNALGFQTEYYKNSDLYAQGKFLPYMIKALENIELSRELIMKFQSTKTTDYIPLDVICENCGKITARVISFDVKKQTVHYACDTKELAGKYTIKGCGHKGETTFAHCKLPWRFEWPAAWGIFETTHEPFGKEHYEGSWQSGKEIARKLYGFEPPIEHVYEFFLVDGKKMAARSGNAYIIQDMLKLMEPEVFLFFYTKRPGKQRDVSISELFRLVDEFDNTEAAYFGEGKYSEKELANIKTSYFLSMIDMPAARPVRIPYTFASMIAQSVPRERELEHAIALLRSTGHIKTELSAEDKEQIARRLKLAAKWATEWAPSEYRIVPLKGMPPKEILDKLTNNQISALHHLGTDLTSREWTEEQLYARLHDTARQFQLKGVELFSAAYHVLLGRPSGPRLAPFILAIGKDSVAEKFRKL
jgi:lysyl-tRNA synthetase class 1